MKGEGAPVNTHHVQLCVYSTSTNAHRCSVYGLEQSVCLRSTLFTGTLSSNILFFFFFSFLKAESLRTCGLRKVTRRKVACLHRAVVFEPWYANLAGSSLPTNSWVKRGENTEWGRGAKICHSDTNHGDLKRSGKLAELRDSADRSSVVDWPRGTSRVQRHSSISWSRSLGTSNCLGTPLFYEAATVSESASTFYFSCIWGIAI